MSTITLPNIRVSSDLTIRLKLKDGGVAIDWSTLQNIRVSLYADDQRSMASRCNVSIDEEDSTILVCQYAANKMQYLGVNRVIVQCKYLGEVKTYDKPAFTFVRWTSDQEGEQITIDDPDVDVEITVEDVSSSILQEAVDAAFDAADRANDAAAAAEHMVDIHTGPEGKSAYEVAVEEGYTGTEEEWLASLKGPVGETPDISIGTVTTVEPGTPAAASMGGTPEAPVLNLSIPKGLVGATPNFTVGTVTTGEPGSSVIVTITGTPEAPVLNLTIPQGMQGNTGSSVEYPYELVNNLTTNDATRALSAAMGVQLEAEVSQLEAKVTDLSTEVVKSGSSALNVGYPINLVPNKSGLTQGGLNDSTGAETTIQYRLRTDYIAVNDTHYIVGQRNGWQCEVLCYKYENGTYTYLGYNSTYGNNGEYAFKSGTTHIRLLINYTDGTTVLQPNNDVAGELFVCNREDSIQKKSNDIDGIKNRLNTETDTIPAEIKEGVYINGNGTIVGSSPNTYVTGKIPITAGDKILWNFGGDSHTTTTALVVFNASGTKLDFFGDTAARRTTPITAPSNSAYFIASMSLTYKFDGWIKVNGIPVWTYPHCFEINNAKKIKALQDDFANLGNVQNCYPDEYWNGASTRAEATGYIAGYKIPCKINVGDSVEWGIADGANPPTTVRLNFYNINGESVDYWGSAGGTNGKRTVNSFTYQNVRMVAVSGLMTDTFRPYLKVNGQYVFIAQKTTGEVGKGRKEIFRLKIAQWNIGLLNYGVSGPIPDAELDTALPALKECFTKIRADLLFVNECPIYINKGDGGLTQKALYGTLLEHFYPYLVIRNANNFALFSKVFFTVSTVEAPEGGSRSHRFGVMNIRGLNIAVAFVHCSPYSVAERVAELTAIAAEFSDYKYGLIVGDTNITNNAESQADVASQMQPLLDAGFTFGNMGYWGLIPTLAFNKSTPTVGPTMSTDNIIVKGFNIDYFDALVEKDGDGNYKSYYSDHYPIRAEISTLIE